MCDSGNIISLLSLIVAVILLLISSYGNFSQIRLLEAEEKKETPYFNIEIEEKVLNEFTTYRVVNSGGSVKKAEIIPYTTVIVDSLISSHEPNIVPWEAKYMFKDLYTNYKDLYSDNSDISTNQILFDTKKNKAYFEVNYEASAPFWNETTTILQSILTSNIGAYYTYQNYISIRYIDYAEKEHILFYKINDLNSTLEEVSNSEKEVINRFSDGTFNQNAKEIALEYVDYYNKAKEEFYNSFNNYREK